MAILSSCGSSDRAPECGENFPSMPYSYCSPAARQALRDAALSVSQAGARNGDDMLRVGAMGAADALDMAVTQGDVDLACAQARSIIGIAICDFAPGGPFASDPDAATLVEQWRAARTAQTQ